MPQRAFPLRSGFTLVELLVVLAMIAILGALILAAVHRVQLASLRSGCGSNLRQMGLALQSYHVSHGSFPPGCNNWRMGTIHPPKYRWLSWMTFLLPHVDSEPLWKEIDRLQDSGSFPPPQSQLPDPYPWIDPWAHTPSGEQRYRALETPIRLFGCPADPNHMIPRRSDRYEVALTSYLGISGLSVASWSDQPTAPFDSHHELMGVFPGTNKFSFQELRQATAISSAGTRIEQITDGAGATMMVGERPPLQSGKYGWWFAGAGQAGTCSCDVLLGINEINLHVSAVPELDECPTGPYEYAPGKSTNHCDVFHFWSLHPGGGHFLFGDGSIRFLPYRVSPAVLRALATRSGVEAVDIP